MLLPFHLCAKLFADAEQTLPPPLPPTALKSQASGFLGKLSLHAPVFPSADLELHVGISESFQFSILFKIV